VGGRISRGGFRLRGIEVFGWVRGNIIGSSLGSKEAGAWGSAGEREEEELTTLGKKAKKKEEGEVEEVPDEKTVGGGRVFQKRKVGG